MHLQPLEVADDKEEEKQYLLCDYNRDGDSFRSPWSNKYDPPLEDGAVPSTWLRELEEEANSMFGSYRDQYYGNPSLSSVYLWDLDEGDENGSFAGCILFKKVAEPGSSSRKADEGTWVRMFMLGDCLI